MCYTYKMSQYYLSMIYKIQALSSEFVRASRLNRFGWNFQHKLFLGLQMVIGYLESPWEASLKGSHTNFALFMHFHCSLFTVKPLDRFGWNFQHKLFLGPQMVIECLEYPEKASLGGRWLPCKTCLP
jgi:hypothetical protein